MNENIFVDQTFQIYKSNGSPKENDFELGKERFLEIYSQFLFKYLQNTNPSLLNDGIITSITTSRDILKHLKTSHGSGTQEGFDIVYFSMKHTNSRVLSRQSIVFIKQQESQQNDSTTTDKDAHFNTIVLVKSSTPPLCEALLRIVESIQGDQPLVIKPFKVGGDYIRNIMDNLIEKIESVEELGNIELAFQGINQQNDSLRQISIAIPSADIKQFHKDKTPNLSLSNKIYKHLNKITKMNFNNLPLTRFTSHLVNISQDGKLKIHRLILRDRHQLDNEEGSTLIWFLLASLFTESFQ